MVKEKRKECYQFTILYFIGIIMVVSIHCKNGGISLFYEWFNLKNFVLAFFAFSSGYFFTNNINRKPLSIIWNKTKKLIIPIYAWNLFYGILTTVLKNIGLIKFGSSLTFANWLMGPIKAFLIFLFNQAAWFVVPLYVVQIISILFLPLLKKKNGVYIIFIIYLILGILGIQIAMTENKERIIKTIIRYLYIWPYFGLGILYKEKLEKHDKLSNIMYLSIVCALEFLLICINNGMPSYTPSEGNGYKNLWMPIAFGYLGIAFWYRISKILVPLLKDNKLVNLISKNTSAIMTHHYLGFFILNLIFLFFNKNFGMFPDFNLKSFQTKIGYQYLPKGLSQFNTVYLIFGIGFSLLMVFIVNKIKCLLLKLSEKYKFNDKIKKYKELIKTKYLERKTNERKRGNKFII